MITHEEFEEAVKVIEGYKNQLFNNYKSVSDRVDILKSQCINDKSTKLLDTDIGVRMLNLLRKVSDTYGFDFYSMTISDLSLIPFNSFINTYGFGKKAIKELNELCHFAGVTLKN